MELPNIIEKITHPRESVKREYFFALQIWDEGVKSAIWTIEEEKTKVLALGSEEAWENDLASLILAVDKSLSVASERFVAEGEEPTKVIFGLPEDWSQNSKIEPEKQDLLSGICQKLELTPIGFVSTFDALNHHLKEVEGVPASAILVSPKRKEVLLAVLEVGKVRGVEKISRSENLGSDVYEGLLRFPNIEALPSRILLFNGKSLEEERQNLIAFPWQSSGEERERLPFLHFPKIEILPYDFDISAVALVGGREAAKSLGFSVVSSQAVEEPTIGEKVEEKVAREQPGAAEEEVDLGFVKDKDVALDFKEEVKKEVKEESLVSQPIPFEEERPKFRLPVFPKVALFLGIILVLLVLVGGGAGAFFWWKFPRAEVTIYLSPQPLEKEIEITIDPNQEVFDDKNMILPGQVIEVQKDGEKTAVTTGEKTVGDHARGEVTVYNRTDSKKIFPEGTVMIGPGNLKYTLDRETTVASKTPDLASGVDKWGESKTAVTAVDIGAKYNLAALSQFSFKDFPTTSFLAKNELAFMGGTSRQIQAVSEEDQKDLLKKLSDELGKSAQADLMVKVSSGRQLAEGGFSILTLSTNFDHKVGDEAQELILKLAVKVTGLTFNKDDFSKIVQKLLEDSVPSDYELKNEEVTSRFEIKEKNKDGSILFKVFIKANLLPKADKEDIIKNIKGKYPDVAQDYLRTLKGFADAEIIIFPKLPGILGTLPRNTARITVSIRSK